LRYHKWPPCQTTLKQTSSRYPIQMLSKWPNPNFAIISLNLKPLCIHPLCEHMNTNLLETSPHVNASNQQTSSNASTNLKLAFLCTISKLNKPMQRTLNPMGVGPNKVGHNTMNILPLTSNAPFKILYCAKPQTPQNPKLC
jgi:hypothetical protein